MESISSSRSTFPWLLLGFMTMVTCALYFMSQNVKPMTAQQKKSAYSKAHILGIYAIIGQIENIHGKHISQIVKENRNSNNINSLIIWLAKEDKLSNLSTIPITNIAGTDQFIDEWRHPYNITLLPEIGTNYGSVERRVNISMLDSN